MSLLAHSSEKSKLLRIFIKSGCVEFVRSKAESPEQPTGEISEQIANLESKRFKVTFGINFLKESAKEINAHVSDKKERMTLDLKKENRLIPYEEYVEVGREEVEILSKIADMEKTNTRLTDIKSEKNKLALYKEQLSVYKDIAIPFGMIGETKQTFSVIGTIPAEQADALREKLPAEAEVEICPCDKTAAVLLLAHKSKREEINDILSSCDFIRSSFTFTCSAAERMEEIDCETDELDKERRRLLDTVKSYFPMIGTLKILYDFYTLEIEKIKTTEESLRTQKTILFEGWIPSDKEEKLKEEIEKACSRVEVEFRDPVEGEVVPSLTKNNKFVSAFDGITDMFGAPNYHERDPKIFVAFYYFLIFGFMLGDAGYGLLMAIACFLFTAIKKPVKNSGQMIIMFAFCGVSTLLWGALFGGWFGTTPAFMEKLHLFWFQPLEEPLTMFALALGVGLLQIGTGFALHGVATIGQGGLKNILLGVLNDFGWVILIIGLFLFSPSLLAFLGIIGEVTGGVATLVEVGKYITLVGAGMMLLSGVIGKKNPVKAVGGVLGNAYGAINVVSDLLSYSRLFGLGLTSGVIGLVVNMLATIIVDTFCGGAWFGWIIAVPVLIIGHAFNLAINLLGAYVHDSRLQYIEFFGRFYDGSGHAFKPIGSGVKYTFIDN